MSNIGFEMRSIVAESMEDLAFQELLADKGIMKRRKVPDNLKERLEEFSLGRSALNLVAGVVVDLSSWVVTPRTIMRVVNNYPFDNISNSESHNVAMWMTRLKAKFPELEEYLTTFSGLGYSLEVSDLNLTPISTVVLHELYHADNNIVGEFSLRNKVGVYSPNTFGHHIQNLKYKVLPGTSLAISTDYSLGFKSLALAGLS